jgi:ATP-dependent Clp protease adaptor protein ClpS
MSMHPDHPFLSSAPVAEPQEETTVRLLPPYHVILENDDYHSMGFVVEVLCQVLNCTVEHACQLMLEAHTSGRAVVWTGPKEVAELKAEQIQSFHEKPYGPLGCTVEPAPGA